MINWKIDLSEILTILILIVGGLLGYGLLDRHQKDDSRFAVIETLAANLKSISPGLDVHYTNQLTEDGTGLELRIYIRNASTHDIWISEASLAYETLEGSTLPLETGEVLGFNNMLAPTVDLCIEVEAEAPENAQNVLINFRAETLDAYSKTLLLAVAELSDGKLRDEIESSIRGNIFKPYGYKETIFEYDENTLWDSFCLSPR